VVYVGIDLHRKTSHVAALDEEGLELLSRRVRNDPEALRALFAELGGEEARVALEAAFGWEWLADLLEGEGIELHLGPSAADEGDRRRAREDRRRRRAHARPPAARRSAPRGLRRTARAARPPRAAPPPHRAHPPAHRAQRTASTRSLPARESSTAAPSCSAPAGGASSASSLCPSRAAAGSRACLA
jgi:Transposase